MDCFAEPVIRRRCAPTGWLAMTRGYTFAFSRHACPRFAVKRVALEDKGAGKTGCTLHPRSRVQLRTKNAHTSIQVQAEHPGLPCAMALRLTSCSPRRTAFLPPSLREDEPRAT